MITIAGVDFDFFMTRMIRYDEENNLIRMSVYVRRKDQLTDEYLTIDVPGINDHLERAFREAGWLNETPGQTEANTDRQVPPISDKV